VRRSSQINGKANPPSTRRGYVSKVPVTSDE
jgi:hypothetical protein